jgi:hypothetical protein
MEYGASYSGGQGSGSLQRRVPFKKWENYGLYYRLPALQSRQEYIGKANGA